MTDISITDGRFKPSWTEERVASLKQWWGEGLSASQIARKLGGTTRNAVIGIVYRNGLQRRLPAAPKTPRKYKGRTLENVRFEGVGISATFNRHRANSNPIKPRPAPSPRPTAARPLDIPALVSLDIGLLDLTPHACLWPTSGEGAATLFCAQPSAGPLPYCEHHAGRCYQPAKQRSERLAEVYG